MTAHLGRKVAAAATRRLHFHIFSNCFYCHIFVILCVCSTHTHTHRCACKSISLLRIFVLVFLALKYRSRLPGLQLNDVLGPYLLAQSHPAPCCQDRHATRSTLCRCRSRCLCLLVEPSGLRTSFALPSLMTFSRFPYMFFFCSLLLASSLWLTMRAYSYRLPAIRSRIRTGYTSIL